MTYRFIIRGNPASKKTSNRVFRCKGRTIVAPSAKHEAWFAHAVVQAANAWRRSPLTKPVAVQARFYRADKRRVDLVNLMQAVADLLERAGILENDHQIRNWDGSRLFMGELDPRVEIQIEGIP